MLVKELLPVLSDTGKAARVHFSHTENVAHHERTSCKVAACHKACLQEFLSSLCDTVCPCSNRLVNPMHFKGNWVGCLCHSAYGHLSQLGLLTSAWARFTSLRQLDCRCQVWQQQQSCCAVICCTLPPLQEGKRRANQV